jgi:hypothetical protein
MLKFILLVVYLYGDPATPQLRIDQKTFVSNEVCQHYGQEYVAKLNEDPKMLRGIMAGCFPSTILEAKK